MNILPFLNLFVILFATVYAWVQLISPFICLDKWEADKNMGQMISFANLHGLQTFPAHNSHKGNVRSFAYGLWVKIIRDELNFSQFSNYISMAVKLYGQIHLSSE